MFRGYLGEPERYEACFTGGWYLSGDLARRDEDGYFWFVGRGDDVIKSAGHLIGPFEVESALMEHPAVAEAGVIGMPDPVAGEVVKAFVVLRPDVDAERGAPPRAASDSPGSVSVPPSPRGTIAFAEHLPAHPEREDRATGAQSSASSGLPEGDTSTLEAAT